MGAISILFNLITIILVFFLLFKNDKIIKDTTITPEKIENALSDKLQASRLFKSLLSDDNAAASNRAEQPVSKKGDIGDFTNFDAVDYEIEKHIVTYNIDDWVDKTDESLTVKSTMDYITV
jgi:hypothetical protein